MNKVTIFRNFGYFQFSIDHWTTIAELDGCGIVGAAEWMDLDFLSAATFSTFFSSSANSAHWSLLAVLQGEAQNNEHNTNPSNIPLFSIDI